MIFERLNIESLAGLLSPHMDKSAWPGLSDEGVKERARASAKQSGLWDKIGDRLGRGCEIPMLKRSHFREYSRTGSRAVDEPIIHERDEETDWAALALWLEHPAANLDYFQDLIWAWCETTWWQVAAHEDRNIDLVSSLRARKLAEFSYVFANQLEPEVRTRISSEVASRALDIALDYKFADSWETTDNNWNTVCNANLVATALYEIKNPRQLAAFIHPICHRMDYAINYYTADGGCVEGVLYWAYGFCHFVDAAIAIHHRTGGAVNLMDDEKIARISRFPMAAFLRAPTRANFADGGHGYLRMGEVLRINYFLKMPELFQLVEPMVGRAPEIFEMRSLALHNGEEPAPHADRTDFLLPDLGYAKVNAADRDVVLAVLAGSNDVSHNHNDIGSFILVKDGVPVLADPGTPVYSAKTFGPQRYEMLVCRSIGHSVPLVNGYEQQEGRQFYGSISVDGLNQGGQKIVLVDLSRAYSDPTLKELQRQFVVSENGAVLLEDTFVFDEVPKQLEEAFITFEPVELQGDHLKIGVDTVLVPKTVGDFEITTFLPEAHEGSDDRAFSRVRFVPKELGERMCLRFEIY